MFFIFQMTLSCVYCKWLLTQTASVRLNQCLTHLTPAIQFTIALSVWNTGVLFDMKLWFIWTVLWAVLVQMVRAAQLETKQQTVIKPSSVQQAETHLWPCHHLPPPLQPLHIINLIHLYLKGLLQGATQWGQVHPLTPYIPAQRGGVREGSWDQSPPLETW